MMHIQHADEANRVKELEAQVEELKSALAEVTLDKIMYQAMVQVAERDYGLDLKKKPYAGHRAGSRARQGDTSHPFHGKAVQMCSDQDDDEIKIIRRIAAKVWSRFTFCIRTTHEGLEDGEEDAAVGWHSATLLNLVGFYSYQCILSK